MDTTGKYLPQSAHCSRCFERPSWRARSSRSAGDISVIFCDCHLECNGVKECATSHEGEKHLLAFAQRHLACLQLSFELRRARTSKICS
jgi:hypothetical protein